MMEKFKQLFEAKKIEFTLLLFGVTLIGVGVFLWKAGVTQTKIEILDSSTTVAGSGQKNTNKIFVDVAGAVKRPGVVGLVSGSRVNEAIASAGGITAEADSNWVAQNLNMAKVLEDGEKIYIPSVKSQDTNTTSVSSGQAISNKININNAVESELDKLPGIGPVTAGKIINSRPYSKIEDLIDRKVVTIKVWEGIKELISAW